MSGMRYALEQLRPDLREQAQRKLAEQAKERPRIVRVPKAPPSQPTLEVALQLMVKRPKRYRVSATRILLEHLRHHGVDGFVREHRFHPVRKWRFDFADPARKLALEIEGLTREGGRHQRPKGFVEDCKKYAEAMLLGWRLIRVTPGMVVNGLAIEYIRRALAMT